MADYAMTAEAEYGETVPDRSDMEASMDALAEAVERASSLAAKAEMRFGPVLRPSEPRPDTDVLRPATLASAPLVERVRSATSDLERLNDALLTLINRCVL